MQKCFKISAEIMGVILVFLILLGIGIIYSFVENIENNTNAFSASAEQRFTGVRHNEMMQNKAKRAAENILGKGIRFKSSEFCGEAGRIVCYTRNVYMEFDTNSIQPVFIVYECECNESKKTSEECETIVERFVFRNMPRKSKAKDAEIYCDGINEKFASYHIKFANGTAFVALRRDTGSVIFYDASELFG